MDRLDYKKYATSTVLAYPTKYKKHLKALFIEAGLAKDTEQLQMDTLNGVDILGMPLKDQLEKCISESDDTLGIIEKWEFEKDYRHSVLFKVDDFDALTATVEKEVERYEKGSLPLYDELCEPRLLISNDAKIDLLKFNLKREAVHPITAEELLTRYPVVVAFHKKAKIVAIRFDSLRRLYIERTDAFYANLVDDTVTYIENHFHHRLNPLDLDFLLTYVQGTTSDVRLIAQSMKMSNGTKAELQVGMNEDYVLPFIGELKDMLIEYQEDFNKVPNLRDAFEQFICEKEETSDYPWIELLWEDEIKTRSIHVKITFNYHQKGYSLLQHYFNPVLIGMERMNRVVDFISSVENNA